MMMLAFASYENHGPGLSYITGQFSTYIEECKDYRGLVVVQDYPDGYHYGGTQRALFEQIVVYRLQKKLPTKILFDFSFEPGISDQIFYDKITYYMALGIENIHRDTLFLLNDIQQRDGPIRGFNTHANSVYINWGLLDAIWWRQRRPHKFSNLDLKDRPNKIGVCLSKLREKRHRALTAHEFYCQGLWDRSVMAINAELEDLALWIDDKKFLEAAAPRLGMVGDLTRITGDYGSTVLETGSGTSTREIFDHCQLFYVNETSDAGTLYHHQMLTEKFYKAVVNRTPFIIQGREGMIDRIKMLGFQVFEPWVNTMYNHVPDDADTRVAMAVVTAQEFLDLIPQNIDEVQAQADHNFNWLYTLAEIEVRNLDRELQKFMGPENWPDSEAPRP